MTKEGRRQADVSDVILLDAEAERSATEEKRWSGLNKD